MKAINSIEFTQTAEYKKIMSLACARLISDRIKDLKVAGYFIKECSMGSGGVGQVKIMSDEIRVQIGFGHGKYNYAMCVILSK